MSATKPDKRLLSLEQIEQADDRPVVTVTVEEWGGEVEVRGLSADQVSSARRKAWNQATKDTDEGVLSAWFLVEGLVAPKLKFAVATRWIGERAFGPVNTILSEIMAASGLGAKAQAAAKSAPGAEPAA